VVIVEGEGAVLGVSLGRYTVVNGKYDGWLCGSGCGIAPIPGPIPSRGNLCDSTAFLFTIGYVMFTLCF